MRRALAHPHRHATCLASSRVSARHPARRPFTDGVLSAPCHSQATISAYSTGPVQPSDAVNKSDARLIRSTCTASGTLLQPSRPASAIDACLAQAAFGGGAGPEAAREHNYPVWSTHTAVAYAEDYQLKCATPTRAWPQLLLDGVRLLLSDTH